MSRTKTRKVDETYIREQERERERERERVYDGCMLETLRMKTKKENVSCKLETLRMKTEKRNDSEFRKRETVSALKLLLICLILA
jgi:hypothetical protein